MLFQLLGDVLDRAVQLRIVPGGHRFWIVFDLDIRLDAVVLDLELAGKPVERGARGGDAPTVEEDGIAADSDQTAPGAHTDKRTKSGLAEVPGHQIAARACGLIDDHRFRPED